jgi:hypothetical protein
MGGHLEMVKYLKRKQVDLEARDNVSLSWICIQYINSS